MRLGGRPAKFLSSYTDFGFTPSDETLNFFVCGTGGKKQEGAVRIAGTRALGGYRLRFSE